MLAAAGAPLRRVELNLDFDDSPGPGCIDIGHLLLGYYKTYCKRGETMADILRAGLPLLESFTLMFHQAGGSHWHSFIPDDYGKPYHNPIYWFVREFRTL